MSSAEEQRERARQWATAQGLVVGKKRTSTTSPGQASSEVGKRRRSGRAPAPAAPAAQVQEEAAAAAIAAVAAAPAALHAQPRRSGPFSTDGAPPPSVSPLRVVAGGRRASRKKDDEEEEKEGEEEDEGDDDDKESSRVAAAAAAARSTSTKPIGNDGPSNPPRRPAPRPPTVAVAAPTAPAPSSSSSSSSSENQDQPSPQDAVYFSTSAVSAVLPALPPGALPLLGAALFLLAVTVLAYVAAAASHAAGGNLTARMDAAAVALANVFNRARTGDAAALAQLWGDADLRVFSALYLAVVAASAGVYVAGAQDASSALPLPLPAALLASSRGKIQEMMSRALARVSSINGVACAAAPGTAAAEAEAEAAPTPRLSASAMAAGLGRVAAWALRWGARARTQAEEAYASLPSPLSPSWHAAATRAFDAAASEGRSRLETLTLYLASGGPRRRALSWVQRLDVTAGAALLLAALLLVVLHLGRIYAWTARLAQPLAALALAAGAARAGLAARRWLQARAARRARTVALTALAAKRLLVKEHDGGPYPAVFLHSELRDMVLEGSLAAYVRAATKTTTTTSSSSGSRRRRGSGATGLEEEEVGEEEAGPAEEGEDADMGAELASRLPGDVLTSLWPQVCAEVARDPRVVVADRVYEGVTRRCWRATGGLSPGPRRPADPPGGPASGARPRAVATTGTGVVLGAAWWLLRGAFEVVVFLFQITVGAFYRLMKY